MTLEKAFARAKMFPIGKVLPGFMIDPTNSGSTGQQRFSNVPAWLIWYQHIPMQANDPAVDPTPLSHNQQDMFYQ